MWTEFEEKSTDEAKIAKAIDKLHPLVQNSVSDGSDYKAFSATYKGEKMLLAKYAHIHPVI